MSLAADRLNIKISWEDGWIAVGFIPNAASASPEPQPGSRVHPGGRRCIARIKWTFATVPCVLQTLGGRSGCTVGSGRLLTACHPPCPTDRALLAQASNPFDHRRRAPFRRRYLSWHLFSRLTSWLLALSEADPPHLMSPRHLR